MASTLNRVQHRDPLTPRSKSRRERIAVCGKLRYHSMINERGWWYYCGCAPDIRGIAQTFNTLRPKARRYKQWAGR